VHEVHERDLVTLYFPQYGQRPEGHERSLSAVATIHRLHTTRMHGGVAGGIRIPEGASVAQWWISLGTDELDGTQDPPRVDALLELRRQFLGYLPNDQPATSLRLAGGVSEAEASRVVTRITAARVLALSESVSNM